MWFFASSFSRSTSEGFKVDKKSYVKSISVRSQLTLKNISLRAEEVPLQFLYGDIPEPGCQSNTLMTSIQKFRCPFTASGIYPHSINVLTSCVWHITVYSCPTLMPYLLSVTFSSVSMHFRKRPCHICQFSNSLCSLKPLCYGGHILSATNGLASILQLFCLTNSQHTRLKSQPSRWSLGIFSVFPFLL